MTSAQISLKLIPPPRAGAAGASEGWEYGPFTEAVLVGRLRNAQVCVEDPWVSEAHGLVTLRNGVWHYLALRGDTFQQVGGQRLHVRQLALQKGQVLYLGAWGRYQLEVLDATGIPTEWRLEGVQGEGFLNGEAMSVVEFSAYEVEEPPSTEGEAEDDGLPKLEQPAASAQPAFYLVGGHHDQARLVFKWSPGEGGWWVIDPSTGETDLVNRASSWTLKTAKASVALKVVPLAPSFTRRVTWKLTLFRSLPELAVFTDLTTGGSYRLKGNPAYLLYFLWELNPEPLSFADHCADWNPDILNTDANQIRQVIRWKKSAAREPDQGDKKQANGRTDSRRRDQRVTAEQVDLFDRWYDLTRQAAKRLVRWATKGVHPNLLAVEKGSLSWDPSLIDIEVEDPP